MKRLILSVLLVSLLSACASQKVQNLYEGQDKQAALIKSSPTVLFKYIDNDEVSTGFIGQQTTYRVQAGERTLMVEYSDLFEISNDEHEKVVSRPAKITFLAEAGKTYQVVNPKQVTLGAAQSFAEKPEFNVINVANKQTVEATVELSRPRTFMTQLRSAVAPVYEFESDQVQTAAPVSAPMANQSVMESLQSLWKSASDADRDAFLQWVNQK
ncbi:DUF2057 family protein [Ketobacter alkanivorans]|uniref:DUF2057 domain-containing protein n=1 Tax=Ketobacter alkanivorans TaxID=1917421 RepID=A0A2K9LHI1_9GAMM|nr:DUF2057 family protein [Ketobacter alkanivorans]AUM11723.1 hypothetical protein Kalk_04500 [Ketobacter alkanivorans]